MSVHSNKKLLTPTEWMNFYEQLFKEKEQLKSSPCPLQGIGINRLETVSENIKTQNSLEPKITE